jgi:hypothetical protein
MKAIKKASGINMGIASNGWAIENRSAEVISPLHPPINRWILNRKQIAG